MKRSGVSMVPVDVNWILQRLFCRARPRLSLYDVRVLNERRIRRG